MGWIPLHVRSQYTVLQGTASVKQLAEKAASFGMSALAITDQGNLYGAVEFYKACKSAKVKPIFGLALSISPGSMHEKKRVAGSPPGFEIVLLAKDLTGYRNLCKLSSIAHLEGFYYTPRVDKETLLLHREGLICLSGAMGSSLAHAILKGCEEELSEELDWFCAQFGDDFYLELQRHEMSEEQLTGEAWLVSAMRDFQKAQKRVTERLIEVGRERGIALVATNGTEYLERDDWRAHEILMNIQSGEACEIWEKDSSGRLLQKIPNPRRDVKFTHELYFKSADEMEALFSDLPDAIANTEKIAEKCSVQLDFESKFYPVFTPPGLEGVECTKEERLAGIESYLRSLCKQGIARRYTKEALARVQEKYPGQDPLQVVENRLEYEMKVIFSKGLADYLLIVHDFISWAKNQKIPVGPGRGSGAGSIILYLIGVTDIEPLRFNLFFERFINPERVSYPDIDVDICMDRRPEVIDYTVRKYGKEKVAQIITFGTMKAKMAIKDVGRTLSVPLTKVNEIAKLIPDDLQMTIEKALEIDPDLKRLTEEDEEVGNLITIARKLEGSVRNTGVHAAGLIICADPLTDHIPICRSKESPIAVTQFSMKPVEAVGMLKIDFLGLKTLTSIQKTVEAIAKKEGRDLDWVGLPLDDAATFALLRQGKTMGLFQLESSGMQDLVKQLHIDKFEEIIAVGALYRPGPMEMIPSFIDRKHGREQIDIDHPEMGDVLAETYGIMVYQEQVMQIASRLAKYSLGEGDVLRKAMGKKDREEMHNQREKFRRGAEDRGISEEISMKIFDKIEKFASYGFNKSHAAAYGYLTYVTAYLKANYSKEWMAALMTCDRDDLTKVSKVIGECQAMGIPILHPDVNESGAEFTATEQGIRFAITAIKGVGEGVAETVVQEREKRGPFTSLFDFCCRIDGKKVGKKAIESLVEAGAFDFTGWTRSALLLRVGPFFDEGGQRREEKVKGVMSLFSLLGNAEEKRWTTPPEGIAEVRFDQLLKREKELLGFYLSGHPMDAFAEVLQRLCCIPLSRLVPGIGDGICRIAFIVESVKVKIASRTQKKFAILGISDQENRFELPIWSDLFEQVQPLLIENQLLYAIVQVEEQGDNLRLQCRYLADLATADESTITESDAVYDRCKAQMKKAAERPKAPLKKGEEKMTKIGELRISLDARKARLSDMLKLKELFIAHGGTTPILLSFYEEETKVGSIAIASTSGVEWGDALEKKIRALETVQKIHFQS